MSAKSGGEKLDSWATLRLAAAQVEEEDQLEGSMGLLQAADEVAAILNLPSPLRNKNQPERVLDKLNSTNDSMLDRTTHSLSLSESQVQTALVHSDADHFLQDMKIAPKPIISNSVAFEDVNELVKMKEKKNQPDDDSRRDSPHVVHSNHREFHHTNLQRDQQHNNQNYRSQRVRDHYLQRLHSTRSSQHSRGGSSSAFQSHNNQHQSISRSAASLNSQPSQLSLRLQQLSPDRQTRLCQSDVQRHLLASMQVLLSSSQHSSCSNSSRRHSDTPNAHHHIRPRTQVLAQPRNMNLFNEHHKHTKLHRHVDREHQFLLYEEAKECVFEPNYHLREAERRRQQQRRHQGGHSDNEDDEKNAKMGKDAVFFAFLSRQEGEERKRREEVKYMQKMLDYDARIDKKVCPSCGAVQSYDEVREKRKQCPACQVSYVSPLCWSQVARQFLKRAKEHQRKKDANLAQLAKDIFAAERGRDTSYKVCDVELFLQRLAEAADRRTQRLSDIEREAYKVATFQPNINRGSTTDKKTNNDEDDMEDELNSVLSADPVRDFLLRYEEDMEDRRKRMPQKFRSKDSHAANAESKTSRSRSPPQQFRF